MYDILKHKKTLTIEDDALDFLIDTTLVIRMDMAYEKTWSTENTEKELSQGIVLS